MIDPEANTITPLATSPTRGQHVVTSSRQDELALVGQYYGFNIPPQTVTFFDTVSMTVKRTWLSSSQIYALAYSSDGKSYYTLQAIDSTCDASSSHACNLALHKFSAQDGAELSYVVLQQSTVPVSTFTTDGSQQLAFTLHPNGQVLYLGDYESAPTANPTVGEYDVATGARTATITGTTSDPTVNALTISADGSTLYIAHGSSYSSNGRIDIFDTKKRQLKNEVFVYQPMDIALTPDGNKLIATSAVMQATYVMNADGTDVEGQQPFTSTPGWGVSTIVDSTGAAAFTPGFEGLGFDFTLGFPRISPTPFSILPIPDIPRPGTVRHSYNLAVGQQQLY